MTEGPRASAREKEIDVPGPGADVAPAEGAEDGRMRRQLAAIADGTTLALFILDERRECTFMNRAAERLTGWTLPEMAGRTLHELVHHTRPDGSPYPADECPIGRALLTERHEEGEELLVHRDGTFLPVAFSASPIREGARVTGTIVEVRDIGREKRAERRLQEEAHLVSTLERVGGALASKLLVQDVVQTVTDEATALTGAQFGAFFYNVLDGQGGKYMLYTLSGAPRSAFENFGHPRPTPVFAPTFHGTSVVRSDDITADPRYGRMAPHHGMPPGHLPVRSYLAVPVTSRTGEVIGGLFFGHAETGRFTERHERLAVGIAGWAALAIDNARLFTAEQRAREAAEEATRRTARLQSVTAALAAARTVEEVSAVIAGQGSAALGAAAGVVALLSADGSTLEFAGWAGYPAESRDAWQGISIEYPSPLTDAARTGEAVWVRSPAELAAQWPEFSEVADVIPTEAWGVVPLVADAGTERARVIGAMGLSFAAARGFADDDRSLAMAIAQQGAQALGRARLFAEAESARAEAERANAAKTEFLTAMSHELRTPLNAIAGYTELLEMGVHGPVTGAQREDLRRIKRNQEALLSLINDVLNFARLEAGRLEIDALPVAIGALVADIAPLVEPHFSAKVLRYDVRPIDPALVAIGDAERIGQVLLNLLTNAAKFTEARGRVTVSASASNGEVRIAVRDTGRGIPTSRLDEIFDPFVQLDRRRDLADASQQGIGMGLAISRELARGMGGELEVESAEGAGSTFTLRLPLG